MENQQEPQTSKKFYEKTWFVVLMLIFIAPVGLLLMWLKKPDWSKKTKIIVTVFVGGLFLFSMFSEPKNQKITADNNSGQVTQKATEAPKKTESFETTGKQTAVQSPTLHVTPAVFQQRYNEYMHDRAGELGASGVLDLSSPVVKSGSVNDAVAYAYNDLNLALNLTIDKNTGEVTQVMLTSLIAGKDGKTVQASLIGAVMAYNAAIYAVDTEADHDVVINSLGMNENVTEWVKDTKTHHNGNRYFKTVIKGVGLAFGVVAE